MPMCFTLDANPDKFVVEYIYINHYGYYSSLVHCTQMENHEQQMMRFIQAIASIKHFLTLEANYVLVYFTRTGIWPY